MAKELKYDTYYFNKQNGLYYTADQIHTKAHMPKAAPPKKP